EHARGKRHSRRDAPVAAPLPFTEKVAQHAPLHQKAFIRPERQLPEIVRGELVPLIKAGEAALGGQIESVLRHDGGATSQRGSIVNGLGKSVSAANGDAAL